MNNLSESYLEKFDLGIKQLFFRFGSETEDNIESMNHVELGYSGANLGMKIKDKDIFVSDIINALEDMEEAPQEIIEYYPDITDLEWQASTRLSTLILLLFEKSLKKHILKNLEEQIGTTHYKSKMINKGPTFFSNTVRSQSNG